MDLITEKNPDLKVLGIDISQNVIEALNKKKVQEKRTWSVVKGDALNLGKYFEKGSVNTIIYSSIIHELFSYIEMDGEKFNHKTIENALRSAYDILPVGGRIIIRDGIMSEPIDEMKIIKFKNIDDIKILDRYCHDFEGREITYELIDEDTVKMKINDAMEFLYTYTWGENSYPLEVKEQFGYYTPKDYLELLKKVFNNKYKIIQYAHFLQTGYEENLLNKISFYNEDMTISKLPDSTCIIVIEKE